MTNDLRGISKKWLEQNGFDGLCSSLTECGCELSDLMPCDEPSSDCEAGYKVICDDACEHDNAEVGKTWHIQAGKRGN